GMEKYKFRRALEEIEAAQGRGTELVTVYVPPERPISDVTNYLRGELSQSSNIKSAGTRKNVTQAIESAMQRLKGYRMPPPTGLADGAPGGSSEGTTSRSTSGTRRSAS